jgi:hypothetical protein
MCRVNSYKASNNNNSIQFSSIYLHADLTAQRPITKRARVEMKKNPLIQTIQKKGNNNNNCINTKLRS